MCSITVPFHFAEESIEIDAAPDLIPTIEAAVRSLVPNVKFGTGRRLNARAIWRAQGLAVFVSLAGGESWDCLDTEILDDGYGETDRRRRGKERVRLGVRRVIERTFGLSAGPWGILTGVRPTKLVHSLFDRGFSQAKVRHLLQEVYGVFPDKIALLEEVIIEQRRHFLPNPNNPVSIYVGIPFCPTRCTYCSFAAYPLASHGHLMSAFLQALRLEILAVGSLLRESGVQVESIYLGGGTPTTVQGGKLVELLALIDAELKTAHTREYTVEAGRPETLGGETLAVLKDAGVNRISINPQSMHDQTLHAIGRRHSVEQIRTAFGQARRVGIPIINMDIILGLPGEKPAHVEQTLQEIAALGPDNLTVHSLALKRASVLKREQAYLQVAQEQGEMMAALSRKYALAWAMKPYYLYRQRYILGDLENVGYARPEKECLYNIQMMEERQTIIALGGGGITKLVKPDQTLTRLINAKCPATYTQRIHGDLGSKINQIRQHLLV
ncbi:MAG TPA: coproporphyrinogen dehydrogenase HemZ [Firmicutes bacterium]|nr:coproporphyrinogen dehydrogenase HemZ [Bacillota bacterium]